MNIDSKVLLPRLGVKVEHKLSFAQTCPVCEAKPPSLTLKAATLGRGTAYACSNCGFAGDAVDLVAKACKLPLEDALERFDRHGDLSDAVNPGVWGISQYLERYRQWREHERGMMELLERWHARMFDRGDAASMILSELEGLDLVHPSGLDGIPQALGLFDTDEAPSRFSFAQAVKKRSTYFYLAYTANHYLHTLEIFDLREPESLFHRISRSKYPGVFNEASLLPESGTTLFVTSTALDTVTLSTRYAALTGNIPQMIHTTGAELPASAYHIEKIILVNHTKIRELVPWLGADRDVRVLDAAAQGSLSAPELLEAENNDALPSVEDQLVDRLVRQFQRTSAYWIKKELHEYALTRDQYDRLLTLAEQHDAPRKLLELLADLSNRAVTGCLLASGSRVVATESGMLGIGANEVKTQLGNFNVTVKRKAVTESKGIQYLCSVELTKVPGVCTFWAGSDDLASANAFADRVNLEFSLRGAAGHAVMYSRSNYSIKEIIGTMGSHLRPQIAHTRLGAIDGEQFRFPGALIQPKQVRTRALAYVDAPPAIMHAYQSIVPVRSPDFDAWADLWQQEALGGYTLGVCQILYCALLGLRLADNPMDTSDRGHLIYTDADTTTWIPTLTALNRTVSDASAPIVLGKVPGMREIEYLEGLGDLPIIATVGPQLTQGKVAQSTLPLILAAPPMTAKELYTDSVSYVCLDPSNPVAPETVSTETMQAVRGGLCELLRQLSLDLNSKAGNVVMAHPVPPVAVYRWIGELMGWECNDAVAELGLPLFDPHAGVLAVFFRELVEQIDRGAVTTKSHDRDERLPRTHVTFCPDSVWIGKRTVSAINDARDDGGDLNHSTIGYLLDGAGYLLEETKHTWKISLSTWNQVTELQTADKKKA